MPSSFCHQLSFEALVTMFNFALKWATPDPAGKWTVIEYEVAGLLVVAVVAAVGYYLSRRYRSTMKEVRTLRAVVPI